MRTLAQIEGAIAAMLNASLPAHLCTKIGIPEAKEWLTDHLKYYDEEKVRLPDEVLLPWSNMIAYDDWENDTFFAIVILRQDGVELFCGTGNWPDVRTFGEGEADNISVDNLHREWSSRFTVPWQPVRLSSAEVKTWLGRDW